ncbi:hypothetical protein C8J57DRAFT_1309832 [Mycena rebaudengoi]|nr:hypothetical protein C8J57DRAFT_1309832 [Mycena rebaudengoi]
MNDPGLEDPIQESSQDIQHNLKEKLPDSGSGKKHGVRAAFRKELQQDADEEEVGYFQPKRWWFVSTLFPLVAGTFGPLANFFSICALAQTWREYVDDGTRIRDPAWLLAANGVSLALSLLANIFLLANFGHILQYSIAQPLTIGFWYLSALLLIIPLALTDTALGLPDTFPGHQFTQSYYYAIISSAIYVILPSLLVANTIGAYYFHAYPPSFNALTIPQRTLMLQTITYVCYLAAGAGVFAGVEGWNYLDAVYWADYTLLTIGLGTDFPPKTHAGRALLIPFAVGGVALLGLVIGSIRGLVLERGKIKVTRRTMHQERAKWIKRLDDPDEAWKREEWEIMRHIQQRAETTRKYSALGSSLLAFLLLWFFGALVFWYAEAPQGWTYFQSLYFSYTALITIGYGDFYPQSTAGKPFFVVWSLMAVPTVTILISNVGDIMVGWVRGGFLRIGGSSPVKHPSKKPSKSQRDEQEEEIAREDGSSQSDRQMLGEDVEHLGEAVEHAEEERGKGGGLAARLAKQVNRLARDAVKKPSVQYEWEDWEQWLELIGESSDSWKDGPGDNVRNAKKRGEWTWIGDDGPLFSGMSETEWILGKLCTRLEEVLAEEIKETRTEESAEN